MEYQYDPMKIIKALLAILLLLASALGAGRSLPDPEPAVSRYAVGTDIFINDVTDFYYTVDASTAPPHYQRYRFYMEDGAPYFYHETREGCGWPQTEEDITASGTVALAPEDWEAFFSCLTGGTVKAREESLDDGDSGPWMYLYWTGDPGDCQEYAFASYGDRLAFEDFCAALRDRP